MKISLSVLLLLVSSVLYPQKARDYRFVTAELSDQVIKTPVNTVPFRLAVVPFSATKFSVQASTQFGDYLTETVIGALAGHPAKIKLFERTRLDAVLKEQEFILTDLMKPAAALKIGQLVPIDVILSGTYTKLKTYIDVSARLIDVASGEILMSYNGRIKMNKNLATLFNNTSNVVVINNPTTQPASSNPVNVTVNNTINNGNNLPPKSKHEICKERSNEFIARLSNLSTIDKINALVNDAIKVPFDNTCGKFHYDIMYNFSKYKIQDNTYQQFILRTLDTIANPIADNRAYEIFTFLAADKRIDEEEWNAGLQALSRVGNYTLSSYLRIFFIKAPESDPLISLKRLDTFLQLAKENKVGLPRPLPFETVFFETMEGLKDNTRMGSYLFKNYGKQLVLDEQTKPKIFHELDYMYQYEEEAQKKTEIVGWLADFFNRNEYSKAHEHLYEFARHFELTDYEDRNEKIKIEFPEADLKILVSRCQHLFGTYAMATPYPSQQEDRINFCVKYNVPVAGVIPSMGEAGTVLRGNNLDEQLRIIKLLMRMGSRPKDVENDLINLFSKRTLEDREKLNEIQTIAIRILGNTKTTSQKAINHMIEVLPHYGEDTEAAKESLVKIGKAAVPALIAQLDKTTDQDGGLQYQLITILGKIGREASSAERSIARILKINRNKDVVYAAEAALQSIK
jgi:TolB-like protein